MIIGALIGSLVYVGSAVGLEPAATTATRYLPADGSAAYERTETTRELDTTTELQVTESAQITGVAGVLSTDSSFGIKVFADLYDEAANLRIWRTTSTTINDPAPRNQVTRVYQTNSDIRLLGESSPDTGYAYRPGLVELPADAHAGQSWTSSGSANDSLDYYANLGANAGEGGCLMVTGEVRYTTKAGSPFRVVAVGRTWCPGLGMVKSSFTFADIAATTTRVAAPVPGPAATESTAISWTDPAAWQHHALDTMSIDPTFGEGPMSGSPITMTPVGTDSGLVVRALSAVNDLVATTPKTRDQWVAVWRAHVPGTILTLTAFGNVIIATTSERAVVAYSDAGVRLWRLDLDELAPSAPVRLNGSDAVLVDLSGRAQAFSILTGEVRWDRSVGSDVKLSPAVGAGLVVIMDRGGTTTALDQGTGRSVWTVDLEGKGAAFVGGTLVVLQDQTAHGLDPATGSSRWLRPFLGTFTRLATVGDRLVIATKDATVLLDAMGAVQSRLGGFLDLTVTPDRIIGWGTGQAKVFGADGTVIAEWPLPALTLARQDRPAVPTRQGVLLFGSEWTFEAWNDEH